MKLDATLLRYMSKEDFRVLTAVEIGMKNHEYVPTALIPILSGLKRGGSHRVLSTLAKYKLVHHTSLNCTWGWGMGRRSWVYVDRRSRLRSPVDESAPLGF